MDIVETSDDNFVLAASVFVSEHDLKTNDHNLKLT